jgi:hypothetical protein
MTMSRIVVKGVVRAGRVEVKEPINLPDGTEVTITGSARDTSHGQAKDEQLPTPEEIVATLVAMDAIEPLQFSDDERAAWEAERQARKAWEKAHFEDHADALRRLWE